MAAVGHLRPAAGIAGVIHPNGVHPGGPGGGAVKGGVVQQGAGLRLHPQGVAQGLKTPGVVLFQSQLLGVHHVGKVGLQAVALQGQLAQLGAAGGKQGQRFPLAAVLLQQLPGPRLQLHQVPIVVSGQLLPLTHNLLGCQVQMVVLPGVASGRGEGGLCHPLLVLLGHLAVVTGQKFQIHLHTQIVGVEEGSVQIKNDHGCENPLYLASMVFFCYDGWVRNLATAQGRVA